MSDFVKCLMWWFKAAINSLILYFPTRGFKFTSKVNKLLYFIEHRVGLRVYISGYDPYAMMFYKTSAAILCNDLGMQPHIVIWPYKNENEFICTLAHELGHIISTYSLPTLNFRVKSISATANEVILREENAWAVAARVIKALFPNDHALNKEFDSLYESCMHSYITIVEWERILSELCGGTKSCPKLLDSLFTP